MKKIKIRKPKNKKEKIEWSCGSAILFAFVLFIITATVLIW